MADDVIETLARLKPAAANRDAILFAAGRASARRSPTWKWLTIGLMVSNLLVLRVWLSPEKATEPRRPDPMWPVVPPEIETPSAPVDRSASLWNLDAKSSEPVPTSAVVPEEHWTARTPIRID